MRIVVNSIPLRIHRGGKVKDAIARYQGDCGLIFEEGSFLVQDKYGNELEHEGALNENSELVLMLKTYK
ncbi:hypothetical protein MASR1M74_31060 [Lentimicrobium sp.]